MRIVSVLGDNCKRCNNALAMCVDTLNFTLYQDLGSRDSVGGQSVTSNVIEVEYEDHTVIPTTFENTAIPQSMYFNQKPIEVYPTLVQKNVENLLICSKPQGFDKLATIKLPNKAPTVEPEINILGNGDFILTMPASRYISLEISVPDGATASNLPVGLELVGKTIKGIVHTSGSWSGKITNGVIETNYKIIVPQIQRVY